MHKHKQNNPFGVLVMGKSQGFVIANTDILITSSIHIMSVLLIFAISFTLQKSLKGAQKH